jgi:hypothetical protein
MSGGEELDRLHQLLETREDLDPELAAYLDTDGHFGWQMLRHPLVYSVPYMPQMNALHNEQLRRKTEELDRAIAARNYTRFVYLHERPYRIDAFRRLVFFHDVNDHEYWTLLGDIWTDTENLWQNVDVWRRCLTSPRPHRHDMMSADERACYVNVLPDEITVYRGYDERGTARGLSWTTNKIVAKFFARRLSEPGATLYLAQGTVDKADVLAYFDGRSEYEVVVLPENVRDIQVTEIHRESK